MGNYIENAHVLSLDDLEQVAGGSLKGYLHAVGAGAAGGAALGGLSGGLGGAVQGAAEGAAIGGGAYAVGQFMQ